jgi:hypothetical protein
MATSIAVYAVLGGLVAAGCVAVRAAVLNAPCGYEDDTGFHLDSGPPSIIGELSDKEPRG